MPMLVFGLLDHADIEHWQLVDAEPCDHWRQLNFLDPQSHERQHAPGLVVRGFPLYV